MVYRNALSKILNSTFPSLITAFAISLRYMRIREALMVCPDHIVGTSKLETSSLLAYS